MRVGKNATFQNGKLSEQASPDLACDAGTVAPENRAKWFAEAS